MQQPGLIARLWRLRRWVAIGVVLAGVAAVVNTYSLPSLKPKELTMAMATTQLYVGPQYTLQSNQHVIDNPGLYSLRASALASMMTSPELRDEIAAAAKIPAGEIAIDGPIANNLQRTQLEPTGEKRSYQIVVENDPYRLTLDQDPSAPVIGITADGPTVAGATALAGAAGVGLERFLTEVEATAHTPQADRYEVSQLSPVISSPPAGVKQVAGLTFIVVLLLWCGLILAASTVRTNLRAAARAGVEVSPGARRSFGRGGAQSRSAVSRHARH